MTYYLKKKEQKNTIFWIRKKLGIRKNNRCFILYCVIKVIVLFSVSLTKVLA